MTNTSQLATNTGGQTQVFSREIGGTVFELGIGRLAPSTLASVTIRYGDTVMLTTLCDGDARPGTDFFPLTVDFEERMYAIGKIPGSFFKREGRPGTDATLAARMTDRPIRPMFPKNFRREVHLVNTLLASDREHPADVLATTAASTAINMSPLPFEGPVFSVQIARVEGELIAFPTYEQLDQSDLNLVVAANDDSVVMIEAGAKQIPEEDLIEAIEYAEEICHELNSLQQEVIDAAGVEKNEWNPPATDSELESKIETILLSDPDAILDAVKGDGFRGMDELSKSVISTLSEESDEDLDEGAVRSLSEATIKKFVRGRILSEGKRADDRSSDEIRELSALVGVLPRVHGSGLFQRGETQVLTVATLGSLRERARVDTIAPGDWKMFMHHYNFPPYSVGEARPLRTPGRREIGHGMLAEKAIEAVLPEFDEFPYVIRLVSDVLSSNGSTSQGATCGSTLALMDAGVPIKAPVAGVAMGLVTNEEVTNYEILTDIAGIEDALGDMDFKVAGTETGVTAVQLDIKLKRLPADFLNQVFEKARVGRLTILDAMTSALPESRSDVGTHAPKIAVTKIDPEKIGALIGPGGKNINAIIAETSASIDVEEDGTVYVGGETSESLESALKKVDALTRELAVGDEFEGSVVRLMNFGAFVELLPGKDGLLHISELAESRDQEIADLVSVGDSLKVRIQEVDDRGRINLALIGSGGKVGLEDNDTAPTPNRGPRSSSDRSDRRSSSDRSDRPRRRPRRDGEGQRNDRREGDGSGRRKW